MVGALGEAPLAAVTLANVPVFVIQLVIFGLQSGSSVLISQYWGKGDVESINRVMGIGCYVAGACLLYTSFSLGDIVTYLPASFCYITSMVIGYAGLRYIELSISSPVCNSSGAVAALLCFLVLGETMTGLQLFGVVLVLSLIHT